METVDAAFLVADFCKFYSWKFDDVWKMPARRFFALLKAKRKIECLHAIDRIDEALIASDNVSMKWYEAVRGRWTDRLALIDRQGLPEPAKIIHTDEQIKETQVTVLELFRQRKQLMGYGR